MRAKGLRFGRTGYRKSRLTGKQTEGRSEMVPKHTLGWSREVCGGHTRRSPLGHQGGQSVALGLLHQAARGTSSECALRNVFSSGSTAHLPHQGGDNGLS